MIQRARCAAATVTVAAALLAADPSGWWTYAPVKWAIVSTGGLLVVTLLKVFLHDLAAIENIFRIGALVGVAVIAFVAKQPVHVCINEMWVTPTHNRGYISMVKGRQAQWDEARAKGGKK